MPSYERLDKTGLQYLLGKLKDVIDAGGGGGTGSGHTIYDDGTAKTNRSGLNFIDFDISDDSTNNRTDVSQHRLTSSELSEIMSTLPDPRVDDLSTASGVLSIGHGGTGVTTLAALKALLDLPSIAGSWSSSVSASIGDTTVTIADSSIATTSTIEAYSENSSGTPVAVTQYTVTSGQVVLTFGALKEATSFKVKIYN